METRVLVLTDVVDSTAIVDRLGPTGAAELWAAHDTEARRLLAVHGGREIDKTDGFLLLFDEAPRAAGYAVAYHVALRALGLTARVGIHLGEVVLRQTPASEVALGAKPLEVDGPSKPLAARVMSVAGGGQTLLTGPARAAIGATTLRVEPRGHWRLKGVADPVELFEIGDADAPFTPPADADKAYRVVRPGPASEIWLPAREVRHNLPGERDPFVGRRSDLLELSRRLDAGARLVSVLGIGGTGKTRLVTRFGWTWLGDWPGGVWFCDLSEARGLDGIVSAVGRALDVPLSGDPITQLGHAIAGRGRCLVLLDNFEQVGSHAEDTLGRWLDRASEAHFVVTTREVLGLRGEEVLALAPLGRAEAVGLFEARGAAAKRGWALTDAERPDVIALVELLDRLPLCIELAAARLRVMPPKMLVARMGERFQLLTSAGARRDRQATLRGVIDWSWDLLAPAEQAALAQLSVFEGGFTLESAEGVLDLSAHPDAPWTMDAVQSLVDKSLVRDLGEGRFDLLVSVQMYAQERLADGTAAAQERHGAHFAAWGTTAELMRLIRREGHVLRRAWSADVDNLVCACRRAIARGDGRMAAALLRAAREVLQVAGRFAATFDLARDVLGVPGLTAADRGWTAIAAGRSTEHLYRTQETDAWLKIAEAASAESDDDDALFLAFAVRANRGVWLTVRRPAEAIACYEGCMERALALGEPGFVGGMRCNLASAMLHMGRIEEARTVAESAMEELVAAGHTLYQAYTGGLLTTIAVAQGRLRDALLLIDDGLALARMLGDPMTEMMNLVTRGQILRDLGRPEACLTELERALPVARELGARGAESLLLGELGWTWLALGRLPEALAWLRRGLALSAELDAQNEVASWHTCMGEIHRLEGSAPAARAHYDQALAIEAAGVRVPELGRADEGLALLDLSEGRPDDALSHALAAAERAADRPPFLAHALATLARVHLGRGEAEAAREALARVDRTLENVVVLALVAEVDALLRVASTPGAALSATRSG